MCSDLSKTMNSFQAKPGNKKPVLRQELGTWIQIFSLFDEKQIPESMLPMQNENKYQAIHL